MKKPEKTKNLTSSKKFFKKMFNDRFFRIVLIAFIVIMGSVIYMKQINIDYSLNPSRFDYQKLNILA